MRKNPQLSPPGRTAMVVDDDPASRMLLSRMLEKRGLEVTSRSVREVDETSYREEILVLARGSGSGEDQAGFRRFLQRIRVEKTRAVDGGGPFLVAIDEKSAHESAGYDPFPRASSEFESDAERAMEVDVDGFWNGSDCWDEKFQGPVCLLVLQQCEASIDRFLNEPMPGAESDPAPTAGENTTAVEVPASPASMVAGRQITDSESVRLARKALEKVPFGALVLDSAEEVVYANAFHAELLGSGVNDSPGILAWLASACPDSAYAENVQRLWRTRIWQKQLTCTFSLRRTDGRVREIEFRPRLLDDDGHLLVCLSDVTESIRNSDRLAVVKAKFTSVFRNLPLPVAMTDRSGRFVDVNPALENLLGHSRKHLLQQSMMDLLATDADRKRLQLLEGNTGNSLPLVVGMKDAEGGAVSVEVSAAIADKGSAGGFLRTYFLRDVTAGQLQHQRLQASQEQNRALLESTRDAIFLLNRHGRIEDLVLPTKGPLSSDPKDWVGKEMRELLPGFGGSDYFSVGEVIRRGEPREFHFSAEAGDFSGGNRSTDVMRDHGKEDGTLHFEVRLVRCGGGHAVAVVHDATLATEGDRALRREALLGEHLEDAVIVCSARGRIEDWNGAAQRLFGYRKHEILSCGLSKLYSPEDAAGFNSLLTRELNQHRRWAAETTFVHKNGTEQRCEVLFLPVEKEGIPISLVGIHRTL